MNRQDASRRKEPLRELPPSWTFVSLVVNGLGRYPAVRKLLRLFVFVPQPVDKHLFFWLVVGHEQVADAASADKVANFFGQVLGMVAGAFERLRHEDNLQAGVVRDILRVLDVSQKN